MPKPIDLSLPRAPLRRAVFQSTVVAAGRRAGRVDGVAERCVKSQKRYTLDTLLATDQTGGNLPFVIAGIGAFGWDGTAKMCLTTTTYREPRRF